MKPTTRELLNHALPGDFSITDARPVSGGDINEAALVETEQQRFFVKWNYDAPADLFEREVEALHTMCEAETELVIPEPLQARRPQGRFPATIAMTYIEPGRPGPDYDERLGRGLAQLHAVSNEAFGFFNDNYCGTTPQPNDWTDDWAEFYGRRRLEHQLELIADRRRVSSEQRRLFDQLLDDIDELVGPGDVAPSLIHGDLWSGNVLATAEGYPAIVDPAAYFGHPEAEIGMMELFGGFSNTVYAAYREVGALLDGWRRRVPLYSLYHLMNHYYLFGGHYGCRVFETVRELVR